MNFDQIIILAKEEYPGTTVVGDDIKTVYLARKIPGAAKKEDYHFVDVVKVELIDKVAFPPNNLQRYCKYTYPTWINQETDNVPRIEWILSKLPEAELEKIKALLANTHNPDNK